MNTIESGGLDRSFDTPLRRGGFAFYDKLTRMNSVIGIIAEKGAGKGTLTGYLKKYAKVPVAVIKSSDVLAETLTLWGIPLTRSNLQNLAIYMDGGFGKGTLSTAVKARIEKAPEEIIIFEGIRWPTDVTLVRSFQKNTLLSITVDSQIRFERLKKRNEKVGEGAMDFNQFMAEENVMTETGIKELALQADVVFENNGTEAEFEEKIKTFCEKFFG
jgi:dephospho-CoA kinase